MRLWSLPQNLTAAIARASSLLCHFLTEQKEAEEKGKGKQEKEKVEEKVQDKDKEEAHYQHSVKLSACKVCVCEHCIPGFWCDKCGRSGVCEHSILRTECEKCCKGEVTEEECEEPKGYTVLC
eukprot:3940510-Rhodomonas_salina.3